MLLSNFVVKLIGYFEDEIALADDDDGLNFECFLPLASQIHVEATSVRGKVDMIFDCLGTGEPL